MNFMTIYLIIIMYNYFICYHSCYKLFINLFYYCILFSLFALLYTILVGFNILYPKVYAFVGELDK